MYANAVRLIDGSTLSNYIAQHGSGRADPSRPVQTKAGIDHLSSQFVRSCGRHPLVLPTWKNMRGRAQLGLTVSCHRALHLYHHWLTWATLRLLCCVTDRSTVQQLAFGEEREEKMSTWQHAWSVAECIWTIMDRCNNGNTAKHRARAGLPCRHVLMIYPRHSTARH